nr:MAG: ORF1 [Torque teno midi virus]
MPFWWRRRRKFWWGRRRYRRPRFNRYKRRKTRRRYTSRRGRRTTRRRRRRYKVRRKRKKIPIQQWQPESITKCKIIGFSTLVLGAEGRQYLCWTNEQSEYIQPKAPGGGQFGSEIINLEWLYSEYRAHNNIWTKSNKNKDLCRYSGCKIVLFRHPTTDFIFSYSIMPPFDLNKFTYTDIHPQNMLLRPHHRIILSKESKPNSKSWVKVKIKPPKLMQTKWFFQKEFAEKTLVLLQATACTLSFPRIHPKAQSQMVSLYYLNTNFFPFPNWGQPRGSTDQAWDPYPTKPASEYKFYATPNKSGAPTTLQFQGTEQYYQSISWDKGWFQQKVLQARLVTVNEQQYADLPINTARYNPNEDTGIGNSVYIISILTNSYKPPLSSHNYIIQGMPLWMALFGFWSFIKKTGDKGFEEHYMFVVESPAIHPISQTSQQRIYPFVDLEFIQGKLPFDEYLSANEKKLWYPKARHQTVTINALVESGPFIQRYSNIPFSTWELSYKYYFYFKWGGPQVHDQPVDDPKYQQDFPTASTNLQAIQISDPKKQDTQTILHEWDYRRGIITQTALKRMSENLQIDTDFEYDDTGSPKKKRKITKEMPCIQEKETQIHQCLQELCKEDTFQETPETLQQLIQQQQQQQRHLKHSILQLLTHLKQQQNFLSLQTGTLE